jgi:flagellar basal-body rod modification protein FlgD
METTAVGGSGSATRNQATGGSNGLESEDFFELLISELRNQDPFNPNETADMIAQVSQIRNIEVSGQLTETLTKMTESQRNLGAAQLIGKYVQGAVPQGDTGEKIDLAGVVTGVHYGSDGLVVLELDNGQTLPSQHLTTVTEVDLTSDPSGAAQDGADEAAAAVPAAAGDDKAATQARRAGVFTPWFDLGGTVRK